MNVARINPVYLEKTWPEVKGFIEDALKHTIGEQSLEDIYNKISDERYTLFVILEETSIIGVCVVSLCNTRVKILDLVLLSGKNFDDWSHYLSILEDEGKRLGVDYIAMTGRQGWERKLKPLGFNKQYTVMLKCL